MKTNVITFITLSCLLSACGGKAGITGLPQLNSGETRIFHYNCAGGEGVDVEYAHMGGSYSATMKIEEAKKVLTKEADGVFRLDDWRWQSADNHYFNLWQKEQLLRSDCVAMHEAASDDLRNVRKSLLDDEKESSKR